MKAIHNRLTIFSLKASVVFANAKILNWKQFTTFNCFCYTHICCFCKCKDTKLKAIHNHSQSILCEPLVVFANAKILNWKQFTTHSLRGDFLRRCFCKCKDTKLKAIHNIARIIIFFCNVVFANAKILNWKQFTTRSYSSFGKNWLFLQMQRY